jgi:hypothetical protein
MLRKLSSFIFQFVIIAFVLSACSPLLEAPEIKDNVSFPNAMVPFSSNKFLMLNSAGNGDYKDGSIQRYIVDSSGHSILEKSFSVTSHASDLALSLDKKLTAIAFDSSVNSTKIEFYNFTDPDNPKFESNITLNLNSAGGKQTVTQLSFFQPKNGGNYYYIYGVINSFVNDDNTNGNIPKRVFTARIANDFSSSEVLFYLSYGLNDDKSLAKKSDSLLTGIYSFGSGSPSFDSSHNLFIAFPEGSVSNSTITTPPYPNNIFDYFNKTDANSNKISCSEEIKNCTQPDLRIVSMFVVDFDDFLNNFHLNNSTYFVPLAWNSNGIPYGAKTNDVILNKQKFDDNPLNLDLLSFSFQSGFWSSYWLNSQNLGNGDQFQQCYANTQSTDTTSTNEYNPKLIGNNSLLTVKTSNAGAEVYQITGLDSVSKTIVAIKNSRGAAIESGEDDFKEIAANQILDPYNTFYDQVKNLWFNGKDSSAGVSPIVPYMYSRSAGVSDIYFTSTGISKLGVLNFGSGVCLPYWLRNSYLAFATWGMESAWLSSSPKSIDVNSNAVFADSLNDPTAPSIYSFNYASGAETCTDVSPVFGSPIVVCANFLTGHISHFSTSTTDPVFRND